MKRIKALQKTLPIKQGYILTAEDYKAQAIEQIKEYEKIPLTLSVITEPMGKGTAAAIALACQHIKDPNALLLFMPVDHMMENPSILAQAIAEHAHYISDHHAIGLFGIKPYSANTQYGYIHAGHPIHNQLHTVKNFIEKPNKEKALQFIEKEHYYWNSGIFLGAQSSFYKELMQYAPDVINIVESGQYADICPTSFDKSVLERSNQSCVIAIDIKWSDIGTWEEIQNNSSKDHNGNSFTGNIESINASNNYVFSENLSIRLENIDNLVIVEKDGNLLIKAKP